MRSRMYRQGKPGQEGDSLDDALAILAADDRAVVWLHVTPDELSTVASTLQLTHHLVEDALAGAGLSTGLAQRTKFTRSAHHAFFYVFACRNLDEPAELQLDGIPIFMSRGWLLTVDNASLDAGQLVDRWESHPELMGHGPAALLHGVLDLVVDSHLQTVDRLSDLIDEMEDDLFDGSPDAGDDPRETQRAAFAIRKSLVRLRRVAVPMRELLSAAMRHEEHEDITIDPVLMPYYQDLYDHVLRVADTLEGLRDLVTSMYETRIALADHTLNTVMKKLAAWAAIIAVPTAVTGFYGQNVRYPLLGTTSGFVVSTVIWLGGAVGLWFAFRRQRWL